MMKDFLGKELQIGDSVVVVVPNYREFVLAQIVAFTPKKVRVVYEDRYGKQDLIQDPHQLVNCCCITYYFIHFISRSKSYICCIGIEYVSLQNDDCMFCDWILFEK